MLSLGFVRPTRTLAPFLVSGMLNLGCSQVLGFEEAELDPELQGLDAAGATIDPTSDADPTGNVHQSLCEEYCDVVIEACGTSPEAGTYAVYDSKFTCLRQCEVFDEGTRGDESGNTAHCRLTNAKVALDFPGERQTACPAAGPGGDGVCGSNCQGYCTLMQAECGEFESLIACEEACGQVPDLGGFDISIIEGDSLQCRLYHLNAALVSPANHCPHAAGAYPCSSDAE